MKLLLFDGFSIACRAFYALPPLENSRKEHTNAVYGFLSIFFRFVDEEAPDYAAVAFDLPKPTFRHEIYGAYKGTRKSLPDELRAQIPVLMGLLGKMGISTPSAEGYEADDVLGTLAAKAAAGGMKPVIVSGDRDLLQLASADITIRVPTTKAGKTAVETYTPEEVERRYGVPPAAFADMKALMGDASDNIPGVPGIGEVTAAKIISAFGSLGAALQNTESVKPPKAAKNLAEFREQALLSYRLAKIDTSAPVELCLTPPSNIWNKAAYDEIRRLELKTLYRRFEGNLGNPENPESGPAPEQLAAGGTAAVPAITGAAEARSFFAGLKGAAFHIVWDEEWLGGKKGNELTIAGDAAGSPAIGMALAPALDSENPAPDRGAYISLLEPGACLLEIARPWLESDCDKWAFDLKSELARLGGAGVSLGGRARDAMLASYVADMAAPAKTVAELAKKYMGAKLPELEDLLGNKGKRQKERRAAAALGCAALSGFALANARCILSSHKKIEGRLSPEETGLYEDIELPLARLLLKMEKTGMMVDRDFLRDYGRTLDAKISALEEAIWELAGEKFNINSTAQLGGVLFGKLGLGGGRGPSTAADVLEKLSHPIAQSVLDYRAHRKLKSTYVDGLLSLASAATGRVHTTYHQALTATGRLSSSEPNLQNIPAKTPLGREIRKAFVPKPGHVFVDADYSQIELRLLAHVSGDPALLRAYSGNEDIHRLTAAQVLGKSPRDVTDDERSRAKAVNFGIVYGMGAFGLSEDLGISVSDATEYIKGYFEKYPGVKQYQEETVRGAKRDGYVSTLLGRRRRIAELGSKSFSVRSFGERAAINTPLQGSAADIMKLAMLRVDRRLRQEGLAAEIVLQVHDELLVETPADERERVMAAVKEEMEGAASLKVPLVANASCGASWHDAK